MKNNLFYITISSFLDVCANFIFFLIYFLYMTFYSKYFFSDIPDIPENIKFLKSLQNADFSSNPLTK